MTIYVNTSGSPLFKRGYRTKIHAAGLNESLAAGLVLLSNWKSNTPFYDIMCGSGTIPIEALSCLGFLSRLNPHTLTFPLVLVTVPPNILRKVVLPAPLGPSKPNTSPCFTSKLIFESALLSFFVLESK